jgi:hypothetical protein
MKRRDIAAPSVLRPRCRDVGGHRFSVRGEAQQRRGVCHQLSVPARAVIALGLAALSGRRPRGATPARQSSQSAGGVTRGRPA